ncbi:NADP-dependent isocitrate dehydrogenase [Conexibacter sp. S30A1]|uniref:NADP-dependent isocitrate dehydrogenase n=1 Tax=Conexibacter sp. S30A1 TaxID=2937800 RepID=UPI00200CB9B2|nr:NADP-dependent isocitrate dehydrogenase [Conexibacter sp. S30A1]
MKIIYTYTDEAPALATGSLLPILETFAAAAGVEVETRDISLAGRILAQFPDRLSAEQFTHDALTELGELAKTPEANIIKLPNISASVPQLKAAIGELQAQGFDIPDYPDDPQMAEEQEIRSRYDRVKGSAVNPVLRQGNSDRRAPASVKAYARKHPHTMGPWSSQSRSHVATMSDGDFRATELSMTVPEATTARIEHVAKDGTVTILKPDLPLQAGEVLDGSVMRVAELRAFFTDQVTDALESGLLYSVHLKATMMKVSDPIIFGHAVTTFFPELIGTPGWDPDDGLGALPAGTTVNYEGKPALAMVDSDRGITNLHVPSDVIIDASMPAAIRASGQMWNAQGLQQDTKFVIPDHGYAALYAETIDDCRRNGAFDPATMGTTPNVGLMAQAAEEYGSHDKTFKAPSAGTVRIVDAHGATLIEHEVQAGDIWRACQAKDAPIRDWVRLAVGRARATGAPAVFWLDETRPHDRELLVKVRDELSRLDTQGLQIEFLPVAEATRFTLARARAGQDTISVTGNILRDYLTDLFPIIELGTSAKMLSIVPLMDGGGMFETGAGGSAPKHVQQFVRENHLRWDSLGEFLALAVSLELVADRDANPRARVLAQTLDRATGRVLEERRSPSRKVGELDNRGSHFYLALYWAQELAAQGDEPELAERFGPLAERLAAAEGRIVAELEAVQGAPVDIGGYYHPNLALVDAAMRPSATLNTVLADFR